MRMYQKMLESPMLPPLPNRNVNLDPLAVMDYTRQVHELLSSSVVVECSNVADYFLNTYVGENKNPAKLFEDLRVVCPPYTSTFYEWSVLPEWMGAGVKRMGLLVLGTKANEAESVLTGFFPDKRSGNTVKTIREFTAKYDPEWIMSAFLFIEFDKHPDPENASNTVGTNFRGPYGTHLYAADKEGNYLDSWLQTTLRMPEEEEAQVLASSLVGILAMSMMNCKNIITRTNNPAKKLNKSRKKKGKKPLISFKTIHVDPNQKSTAKTATTDGNEDTKPRGPVHGHMKDYRSGKGLFGKYKGVYYWGPQLRGDATKGISLPDYTIDKKAG
jgi:hypothetical protein